MDLVDEQHVVRLERGQDRGDVTFPFERRPGNLPDLDVELAADDLRQRGLAETRRPREEHVVERLPPALRCIERNRELLLHPLLADEIGEGHGTERRLELLLSPILQRRCDHPVGHAALFSAARTCSSTGSERSIPASARSASTSGQPSSTSASRARSDPSGVV